MRKLSARWVPRLLTLDHKRNHVTTSKECLAMFSRNPDEFLRRFVTVDETWIHHNTPETKKQSKQFDVDLKQKRPHLAKKKVLFHQDNARVHTCLVTMAKIHELRYELLPHPAYSPDLAPSLYQGEHRNTRLDLRRRRRRRPRAPPRRTAELILVQHVCILGGNMCRSIAAPIRKHGQLARVLPERSANIRFDTSERAPTDAPCGVG
ncbi:Histone-lysine N-methyltransferase SETMAR [Eumeta japonica]|uniref:Histone-lysine N-methyltransferase SETMAR n=1 Tax=Eumeta variegata TaxID=151549 RepID=A0A4C1XL66_EUMVA|nr:Histone-lysine N-methyltransferase SETMAR [Eumeta japonica]